MTIKDCYARIAGDFDGVMSRLMTEARVEKFALRFLDDTTLKDFNEAFAQGDITTSFRAAHTLKGVASNLGFTDLYTTASAVTEDLRDGNPSNDINSLVEKMNESYKKVAAALTTYKMLL